MPDPNFEALTSSRAISLILSRYGIIGDLPEGLAHVVWVTVFRACAIGLTVENDGGVSAIVKSRLSDGLVASELEERILQMQFLRKIIPIVRKSDRKNRQAVAQLATDVLKWGIVEAANMSSARRSIARLVARADPMYKRPVPHELLG